MKRSIAVSIALLGSIACKARDVDVPSTRGPALVACHGAASTPPARTGRPDARTSRRGVGLPGRALPVGLAQLEAVVRARMPEQGALLHRALAKAIHDETREARLDPLLVLALIHVESAFDPGAVSYAGAIGLMQLRERTLHRELERAGMSPADRDDPVTNVRAGIRYLHRLVRAFGSTDVALMAYNAGPNRILTYYRAGEIPDRFHAYPQRIRSERERLRSTLQRANGPEVRRTAARS